MSCGGGRRNKSRVCDNPLPDAGGLLCPSTDGSWLSITSNGTLKQTDTQICNLADCPTTLTTTTTPPDKGIISNHNFVQLFKYKNCTSISIQMVIFFIKVDGRWAIWSDWSTCSTSCGDGQKSRIRICDSPLPKYGGSNCILNNSLVSIIDENGGLKEIESKTCALEYCPGTLYSCSLIILIVSECLPIFLIIFSF